MRRTKCCHTRKVCPPCREECEKIERECDPCPKPEPPVTYTCRAVAETTDHSSTFVPNVPGIPIIQFTPGVIDDVPTVTQKKVVASVESVCDGEIVVGGRVIKEVCLDFLLDGGGFGAPSSVGSKFANFLSNLISSVSSVATTEQKGGLRSLVSDLDPEKINKLFSHMNVNSALKVTRIRKITSKSAGKAKMIPGTKINARKADEKKVLVEEKQPPPTCELACEVEISFQCHIQNACIRAGEIYRVSEKKIACEVHSCFTVVPLFCNCYYGLLPCNIVFPVACAIVLLEKDLVDVTVERVCPTPGAPRITRISPTSAEVDVDAPCDVTGLDPNNPRPSATTVTITGTNLYPKFEGGVLFNGFCAKIVDVISPTTIVVQVPPVGCGSEGSPDPVTVQVINSNGAKSNTVTFSFENCLVDHKCISYCTNFIRVTITRMKIILAKERRRKAKKRKKLSVSM